MRHKPLSKKEWDEAGRAMAKLAGTVLRVCQQALERDGALVARAVLYRRNGRLVEMILPFQDMDEKLMMRRAVREACRQGETLGMVFASDSWVSEYRDVPTDAEQLRIWKEACPLPEDDPHRSEALTVCLFFPGSSAASRILYRREAGRIIWGKQELMEGAQSEWNPWEHPE